MLTNFASLTYPDLKLTDGKNINAAFRKGVFQTDNPKVIEYLRKCKAECVELKPTPLAKVDDKPKVDNKLETKKTGE